MRTPIIIAAAALLLAGGGAFLLWRPDAPPRPRVPFADLPPPRPPHYADPALWAALPLPDQADAADGVPADETLAEAQMDAEADAFYIHPTTYAGAESWNQDLAAEAVNALTENAVAAQASMFNACCQVYAPRYRQATLAAETAHDEDSVQALDLAYQDVKRAFLYYVDHFHHERPFILAGHGQGARHALRLLQEVVDGTPLAGRLVAAYVTDAVMPRDLIGTGVKTLGICDNADDLGCVASWTLSGRANRALAKDVKDVLCVNPLTFNTGQPAAPADSNLGALVAPVAAPLPALTRAATGAACAADGLLHVEAKLDGRALPALQGTTLFYANIRANAALRVQTFLQSGGGA